jgi:hypothetical protein
MLARLCLVEARQCIATKVTLAGLEGLAEEFVLLQCFPVTMLIDVCARFW